MAKKLYWIGDGVTSFKGIDYGKNDLLPDDFPKDAVKKFKKSGLIGEPIVAISASDEKEIEALQARVSELEREKEGLEAKITMLEEELTAVKKEDSN